MTLPTRGIELSEGDEFAGYRVERRLGRGGMGVLYLAHEPGLERRVALKLIAPEAASDEVFARRFAEESRIAASIEHPNVVPIYAAGEEDGVPYIAMRYVSGADLGRRLAHEGRIEPRRAVELIAQIGNGLDAIHAAGLVHRDVKPANVLLSGDGGAEHPYITDFGVARNVSTESGLTQTGRFVGTLDYVAPEQISGGAVDARADVYALGCLLFKSLTGEVPFPKEGDAARLFAHLNDPPPAPSLWVPEVTMALDDVVIRAMSKGPDDRYPSAGDLGRAAQAALRGGQPSAPERTVATGAAATRTAESVSPGPASDIAHTGGGSKSEAPTERIELGRSRLWLALGIGAAALVGIVAVMIAIASGGDGSGAEKATGDTGAGLATTAKKTKPNPKPLSQSELIAKADAICEESQETYGLYRARFPSGENEPDPIYSRLLAGISKHAVEQFNELQPPPGLEAAYRKYVKSQERVAMWDRKALQAAERGDASGYLAMREARDITQSARKLYAEQVGLHVCSGSEL
jgi:serine/threonine protein kinase